MTLGLSWFKIALAWQKRSTNIHGGPTPSWLMDVLIPSVSRYFTTGKSLPTQRQIEVASQRRAERVRAARIYNNHGVIRCKPATYVTSGTPLVMI
jgi:hypothetical protein